MRPGWPAACATLSQASPRRWNAPWASGCTRPGVRDLLAAYPTLIALRAASQSRIEQTVKARSPCIAAKVSAAVAAALAA